MLKEIYEAIARDAGSREAKVISGLAGVDPRKVFVWEDGDTKEYAIQPGLRAHKVERLDDIATAIDKWESEDGGSLWVGGDAVVLATDDGDRRDTVRMPLVHTPEFCALKTHNARWLSQDEMVAALRRDLRFVHARDVFLASVRKIRWASSDGGEATIQHGKESLGRQVEKSVAGLDAAFPEEVTCGAQVYVGVDSEPYPFVLTVDVNLTERKFRLSVLPGQLDEAALFAREHIARKFKEVNGLTVVLGTM